MSSQLVTETESTSQLVIVYQQQLQILNAQHLSLQRQHVLLQTHYIKIEKQYKEIKHKYNLIIPDILCNDIEYNNDIQRPSRPSPGYKTRTKTFEYIKSILFKHIDIEAEHILLIQALISPSTHKSVVKEYEDNGKGFMFEIVANESTGIDVGLFPSRFEMYWNWDIF